MGPLDYTMDVISPINAALSGYNNAINQGIDRRGAIQAQDIQAKESQQNDVLFGQGQEDRVAGQEAAAQAAIDDENLARQMQGDMNLLLGKVKAGTATSADFMAFTAAYPDIADDMKGQFDGYTAERKDAETLIIGQAYNAIKSGQPKVAVDLLEQRAIAAENAGMQEDADSARSLAATIEGDASAGEAALALTMNILNPDLFEKLSAGGGEAQFKVVGDQLIDLSAPGGPKPVEGIGASDRGPEWVDLTPEELVQYGFVFGQRNSKTGKVEGEKPPKGQTISVGADGSIVIADGVPVGGAAGGLGETVTSAPAMVSAIDEIMNDPALAKVTGTIEGGGGNSIDDMSTARRVYYGEDGTALIQKIGQLQNTTFLAARQMLKGGGAITDFESKKAEAAMARLSRATGEAEFKQALTDLKDAISEGERKLKEAGKVSSPPSSAIPAGVDPAVWDTMTPEEKALFQ